MKSIEEYLDKLYEKHQKNWDTVICICGKVGVGKSNLALHMLDYWFEKQYGDVNEENIRNMSLTKDDFIKTLSYCNKKDAIVFDEAGELSSRGSMTRFNKDLMVAYQIIRADNLFTILVIPDIKYLDSYFRNTRVKHLFYVYKRGRCRCWLNDKFKILMGINENYTNFNYNAVSSDFFDTFPIYKGVMAKKYEKLKNEKTKEARLKLLEGIKPLKEKKPKALDEVPKILQNELKVELLKSFELSNRDIAEKLGLTIHGVQYLISKINARKNLERIQKEKFSE